MKKHLCLAALAALGVLTCSCIHEREFVRYEPEPEAISFVLGSTLTRAEKEATPQVNRYSLGTDDNGHLFTLEETVTWLDDIGDSPATRGTPAYTENLQQVHGSAFNGRAYNATSGDLVIDDGSFYAMEDGVRWRRAFGFDPWPDEDDLTFFIRMPVDAPGLTITGYDASDGTISFNYQTPATAEDQQDILFAKTTLDKDSYMSDYESNGGASILLRHALTGIKFAIASDVNDADEETGNFPEDKVETYITKVEFLGLISKGSAVYDQDDSLESSETGDNRREVYSSRTSFTWTPDETSRDAVFSQEYTVDNIITYANPYAQPSGAGGEGDEGGGGGEGGGGEGEIDDRVHAAESFYLAGNERNLNDETASLTFWFIPQEMTTDVKVRVTFYVWDGQNAGELVTRELDLGATILSQTSKGQAVDLNHEWKAGQIRTFKLSPTSIDVDLTVEPDPELANTIDTPVIRNIGNKEAYLRVVIVGNWVDSDQKIYMGDIGIDETTGNRTFTVLTPWSEDNTTFGTFTNLGASGAWVKKTDGFWYYTQAVPAGLRPGETASGGAYVPLFEEYTKGTPPIPDVDLMLDVAVQAVDAKAGATYEAAWTAVGAL